MINEFNEIFSRLAEQYDNVFHIDNRGLAKNRRSWFDELHLRSKYYKKVAKAYGIVIENHDKLLAGQQKVIRTVTI